MQSIQVAKRTSGILIFIYISFYPSTALSQENKTKDPVAVAELSQLSGSDLLRRARQIRHNDPEGGKLLATKALKISKDSGDLRVVARAHSLLGELAQKSKAYTQSKNHFLQASLIYKETDDKRNQILSTVDYIEVLYDEKSYKEGIDAANSLLPVALEYGDDLSTASVILVKGNGYYKQKKYEKAQEQYTLALDNLSDRDDVVQSRLAETYHQIAQTHKHLKENDEAIHFFTNALNIYKVLQKQQSVAHTLKNLADIERKRGNNVEALDYAIRGIEVQKKLDNPIALAKALRNLGVIYRNFDRFEESLEQNQKAYLIFKNAGNIEETAETSNQIGLIYTRLKQFDQARSFYQHTIDAPQDKVKPKTLASALREIAVIDLNTDKLESAMTFAKKAHAMYQESNESRKRSQTARILGKIYRQQANDDQAEKYFREALMLAEKTNDEVYQIKSLTQLGIIMIDRDITEAVSLLKRSLKLAEKNEINSSQFYANRWLRRAEKLRGNIADSLSYAEREIKLSEIIQKERDESEIFKAKARLDSHKKEMELDSLRKKVQLDQLELAQKSSEIEIIKQANRISELELTKNRYASIALTTLLIICLGAAIYIYKIFAASKKRNRELDYLAARDPLTNCYNRRTLFDLMNRDFADIETLDEYSLIMVDIDHFKQVNDNYGHSAGDAVLRGVASVFQSSVRQNDITARYGGEEFCLVLPGANIDQATQIAEKLRQKVEEHPFDGISVTCSLGVTSIHSEAKDPSELIDQADLALYKSKTSGRNRVTLWDPSFSKSK